MNSFGRIFRLTVFGESHGEAVGVVLDGVRAGIALTETDFAEDLRRRQGGKAGTTPRVEADEVRILSGAFNGYTTGAPLTLAFFNTNTRSKDYNQFREQPRPGHADLVAMQKFGGYNDHRGGGHFSGRLTVLLVAAGVVAKKMLPSEVEISARLAEAGGSSDIEAAINAAIERQDSIGGIVECCVNGLPIGLGSPFFDSVESVLAHLIFAIPAVKGVEFGSGFAAARMQGSTHNDAIIDSSGRTQTNHAGGIVGGLSNGNPLTLRIAIKPTSSTPKPQMSYHFGSDTMQPLQVAGRHDLCIALRVPVVLEAVVACGLVDLLLVG